MHYVVLLNNGSGALRGPAGQAQVKKLRDGLAEGGVDSEVIAVGPKELDARLEALLRPTGGARPDAVIVGGGDGSVSAAARALVGQDTALGVLPLGTFNLFARALGMPLAVDEAVRALLSARPTAIDTMEVNGRTVLQHLSIGLQPRVILLRQEPAQATRLDKLGRGLMAWMRVIRCPPRVDLDLDTGGKRLRRSTSGILVSNDPLRAGLGAAPVSEDLQDGEVAVYVSVAASRAQLVRLSVAASLGLWRETGLVEEHVGRRVEIATRRRRRLLVSLDGELQRLDAPLRCRSVPGSLNVLLPAG